MASISTFALSATRLATYRRCAHAYYLRYHRRVPTAPVRASVLGDLLHQALSELHRWPAWKGIPPLDTLQSIWIKSLAALPPHRANAGLEPEGWGILLRYYQQFIAPLDQWQEPLGVEGSLQGHLVVNRIRFRLTGRYDRLEWMDPAQSTHPQQAQLHLIDYKTSRHPQPLSELERDLQLGLYQIALEQVYGGSLVKVSHFYLRSGESVSFRTNPDQKVLVQAEITSLAQLLLSDDQFEPQQGHHCHHCNCRTYCSSFTGQSDSTLPERDLVLQLSLC